MPQYCYIKNCKSRTIRGTSMHSIPKDKNMLKQWIESINDLNSQENADKIPKTAKICSLHFEPDCFQKIGFGNWHLKKTATPTIFPNNNNNHDKIIHALELLAIEHNYSTLGYFPPTQKEDQKKIIELDERIIDSLGSNKTETKNVTQINSDKIELFTKSSARKSARVNTSKSSESSEPTNKSKLDNDSTTAKTTTINNLESKLNQKLKAKNSVIQKQRMQLTRRKNKLNKIEQCLDNLKSKSLISEQGYKLLKKLLR